MQDGYKVCAGTVRIEKHVAVLLPSHFSGSSECYPRLRQALWTWRSHRIDIFVSLINHNNNLG